MSLLRPDRRPGRRLRPTFARAVLLGVVASSVVAAGCASDDHSPATTAPAVTRPTGSPRAVSTAAGAPDTGGTLIPVAVKTISDAKLTVCSDIPYAPFEFYATGTDGPVVGIDADIVGALAARLGLTPEFRRTPFAGIFAALAAKSCDVIASSVSITDARKQANDFTDGYFTVHQSILVPTADAATVTDLPALRGKKVGVLSDTPGAAFAEKDAATDGYEIREFQGADELIGALRSKDVDAVVQDSPVNGYAATRSNGELTVSKVFDDQGDTYGLVVSKDNPDLTKALNDGLLRIRSDGWYAAILKKYLGDAAPAA